MTTRQPPSSSHLDPTTLADLDEQLLDLEGTARAWEHLATCPTCQAQRDALADVRGMLRSAGEVTPVPDDVAQLLDDALLAAAGGRSAQRPTGEAATTVTPMPSRHRAPWNTRILQAAAVVVLLLALGGLGLSAVQNAMSGGSDTASSAGKAPDSGSPDGAGAAASGDYPVTQSGRDYTHESLLAAVPALIRGQVKSSPVPRSQTQSEQGVSPLLRGQPLAACVANLADGPVTPLAVDAARYDGKPATIIVLPTAGSASTVDVFVVAPDCPKGTFIAWQRVGRP